MPRPPRNPTLSYDPRLRALARELRKHGTLGEVLLWKAIKKKTLGCEFHRQFPIGKYIVDFYCPERVLAIEVDGSSHHDPEVFARDENRQRELEAIGLRFLRFREADIRKDVHPAVQTIKYWLEDNAGA